MLRIFNIKVFWAVLTAILIINFPIPLSAKVTGICSNCHVMHNSQNGVDEDSSGPYDQLLRNTCVGCHLATSDISQDPVTGAPIVWNLTEPTYGAKGLAGGNFYWVANGDDTKGHNVDGVANPDGILSTAPGRPSSFIVSCTNSCHDTLAGAPNDDNYNRNGCERCHVFTYHHEDNGVYRFLKGHGANPPVSSTLPSFRKDKDTYPDYVTGVEDDDWEQETSTDHNYYKGYDGPVFLAFLQDTNSISSYCGGCHWRFHKESYLGGVESPWIRHPTDIVLPQEDGSEYASYDPVNSYDDVAPVAWTSPSTSPSGPIVMCLSCHRAHGSEYKDMLRWDYSGMVVGTTGSTAGTGCFVCHTKKDGVE